MPDKHLTLSAAAGPDPAYDQNPLGSCAYTTAQDVPFPQFLCFSPIREVAV